MKSYINNGWATKSLINPDGDNTRDDSLTSALIENWASIRCAFSYRKECLEFNHGHMVSYFVSRTAADGLPAGDEKSINKSARNLYQCGHIQSMEAGYTDEPMYLRAICILEMKRDLVYKVTLRLNRKEYDITGAICGCPAGKGPKASCKHVGALCYAFAEFSNSGELPHFLTCTDKLQAWSSPKPKKVEHIPVESFSKRKDEIMKVSDSKQYFVDYDPRPPSIKVNNQLLLENLKISLLQSTNNHAFLQLLIAPFSIAMHDHTYALTLSHLTP